MDNQTCPSCKNETPLSYEVCTYCKFPFTATDKEKAVHIGRFISAKNILDKSEDNIQNSKNVLYFIAGFNILGLIIAIMKNQYDFLGVFITSIITLIILFCGIFLQKSPKILTIIPLIIILLFYLITFIFNNESFLNGIVFKIVIVGALVYNLYT
ncbi:MAG: hypothetical protein HC854_05715 [Flavobacterium sp.]|nr:hypothetical protein [Flavobacterium sp.]